MISVDDNGVAINWDAVFTATRYYNENHWDFDPTHDRRYEWMRDTWGIDHGTQWIKIVDEQKYMMMLLRFA
jgi:hypothetical protein